MGETRLEDFISYELSVYIDVIYSEACCHPFCGHDLAFVFKFVYKPACSICGQEVLASDRSGYYFSIGSGNPYG